MATAWIAARIMLMVLSQHMASLQKETKQRAIQELLGSSTHSRDFYILLIGAVLLAIGGIFADSIPVLIASMIVAPLAYPILALGLAIAVGDVRLLLRTSFFFLLVCVISLLLAILATIFFSEIRVKDVYITFTTNHYLAFMVAIVAGGIAAYGTLRPKVAAAITGVAIAVSLMPPLVATGIGIASLDSDLMRDASAIFGLNVLGILMASTAVFSMVKMRKVYKHGKK